MKTDRANLMIQYALVVAGEADDFRDRELGPIHLLKYLYLGDLAFAKDNDGRSYSEAHWTFYKFGPWSAEVHSQISTAAQLIGARERRFTGKYRDDNIRWLLRDVDAADLELKLPASVATAIRVCVKRYASDTVSLLHYVYRTPPMLTAAPGELLDFTPPRLESEIAEVAGKPLPSISKVKLRRLKERIEEIYNQRKARESRELLAPNPPPVYDDVYFEGVEWLDGLAGASVKTTNGKLTFDHSIWKSEGRRDPEVP